MREMTVTIPTRSGPIIETVKADDPCVYRGVSAVRSLAGQPKTLSWFENMKAEQRRAATKESVHG